MEQKKEAAQIVSNGAQHLAPGTSHTLSGIRDMLMCPGPLPLVCISSEVKLAGGHQKRLRMMAQLKRLLA